MPSRIKDGVMQVSFFKSEQEYVLLLLEKDREGDIVVGEFRICAVEEDPFRRRPYKGDLHLHSSYSDGSESPAHLAGASRRIGLDFMAVTDHGRYAPSLEAIQAFSEIETGLQTFNEHGARPESPDIRQGNHRHGADLNRYPVSFHRPLLQYALQELLETLRTVHAAGDIRHLRQFDDR